MIEEKPLVNFSDLIMESEIKSNLISLRQSADRIIKLINSYYK